MTWALISTVFHAFLSLSLDLPSSHTPCAMLSSRSHRMLTGTWNPILCPISAGHAQVRHGGGGQVGRWDGHARPHPERPRVRPVPDLLPPRCGCLTQHPVIAPESTFADSTHTHPHPHPHPASLALHLPASLAPSRPCRSANAVAPMVVTLMHHTVFTGDLSRSTPSLLYPDLSPRTNYRSVALQLQYAHPRATQPALSSSPKQICHAQPQFPHRHTTPLYHHTTTPLHHHTALSDSQRLLAVHCRHLRTRGHRTDRPGPA